MLGKQNAIYVIIEDLHWLAQDCNGLQVEGTSCALRQFWTAPCSRPGHLNHPHITIATIAIIITISIFLFFPKLIQLLKPALTLPLCHNRHNHHHNHHIHHHHNHHHHKYIFIISQVLACLSAIIVIIIIIIIIIFITIIVIISISIFLSFPRSHPTSLPGKSKSMWMKYFPLK